MGNFTRVVLGTASALNLRRPSSSSASAGGPPPGHGPIHLPVNSTSATDASSYAPTPAEQNGHTDGHAAVSYADVVAGRADEDDEGSFRSAEGVSRPYDDRHDSHDDDQDDDDDESDCESGDEDQEGEDRVPLVQVPYSAILRRHLIVPFLAIIFFGLFVVLLIFAWPPPLNSGHPYPHLPHPSAFLIGLAVQSLSHSLRIPIYTFLLLPLNPFPSRVILPINAVVHTTVVELLRLLAILVIVPPLANITHDDGWISPGVPSVWSQWESFDAACWLGLGWAAGDVGVGIWQTFSSLAFYAPILPRRFPPSTTTSNPNPPRSRHLTFASPAAATSTPAPPLEADESAYSTISTVKPSHSVSPPRSNSKPSRSHSQSTSSGGEDDDSDSSYEDQSGIRDRSMRRRRVRVSRGPSLPRRAWREGEEMERLQENIFELLALQERENIEALLGVPLPNIPAIVSALWRIDSLFLNMGVTLVLGAVVSLHRADLNVAGSGLGGGVGTWMKHVAPIVTLVVGLHAALSVGWLVGVRGMGAPVTTYASLFVGLGAFFWGLGSWGALV